MVQADVIVGEISTFHGVKNVSLCFQSNGQWRASIQFGMHLDSWGST